jgi:Domain of unknown function (DUF4922)
VNTKRLIDNKEIISLVKSGNYADASVRLLNLQREEWGELAKGYNMLESVKLKTLLFEGFKIELQFNPGRIKSTSAKVDKLSIKNRDCFLCDDNLPMEQKGIALPGNYFILCNPYPVFPEHFTIVAADHKSQEILTYFQDFLSVSRLLGSKYSLIYNGPKSGASAPDHLHFQAGKKQFMPIEYEFFLLKNEHGEIISENDGTVVTGINDGLRKYFSLESKDEKKIAEVFNKIYDLSGKISGNGVEPKINLMSKYDIETGWLVIIFLRSKHRSSHYYLKGKKRIIISPAAIDLGGICVVPIQKDFERLDEELIREIYNEVFISNEAFEYIKSSMKKNFT